MGPLASQPLLLLSTQTPTPENLSLTLLLPQLLSLQTISYLKLISRSLLLRSQKKLIMVESISLLLPLLLVNILLSTATATATGVYTWKEKDILPLNKFQWNHHKRIIPPSFPQKSSEYTHSFFKLKTMKFHNPPGIYLIW